MPSAGAKSAPGAVYLPQPANEAGIRGSAAIIVGFMLPLLIPDAGRIGVDKARPHNMDLGKAFQLTYLVAALTRTGQSEPIWSRLSSRKHGCVSHQNVWIQALSRDSDGKPVVQPN